MHGSTTGMIDELGTEGRHARLSALFDAWSADVHGFVLARAGSHATAQDVTAEVFLAAARAIGGDDPDQVTRSWLLTTARRRLIDHWRRQRTQRNVAERMGGERPTSDAAVDVDRERVRSALASLTHGQLLALTMRYMDDH